MKFNEKLTALRKEKGYSQESFAEKIGVTRQAVSRWELGETTPELLYFKKISELFSVSADWLLDDTQDSIAKTPTQPEATAPTEHSEPQKDQAAAQQNPPKKRNRTLIFTTVTWLFGAACFMTAEILAFTKGEYTTAVLCTSLFTGTIMVGVQQLVKLLKI